MYSQSVVHPLIAKWFDVRPGEAKLVGCTAAVLFTTIAGHTLMETARDALFLRELQPSRLTLVYGVLALLAIAAAKGSTMLSRWRGEKRALVLVLVTAAVGAGVFFGLPKTRATVFGLYLWVGLVASVAVAQFWTLASRVLTVAQAKRLVGPIASAGILGGVAGGTGGVLLLRHFSTNELLPVAAGCFLLAAAPLRWLDVDARPDQPVPTPERDSNEVDPRREGELELGRRYLRLVTLLIATATMTLLCIDYVFKASAARQLESGALGPFFAAYYATLNLVAFVFQFTLATHVLRRLGVLASVAVLPVLLLLGSVMTFVVGPALGVVLLVKGADGSLRHSLHRTSTELLWMPLPSEYRGRTKPFVDTFLVRFSQALAAAAVFVLALWQLDTPRVLSAIIVSLALLWIVSTVLLRQPYLTLFRSALQDNRTLEGPLRLTLASLEVIVEALSSMNPSRATAAIHLLSSHGKSRLIPALTLFHPATEVVLSALEHVPAADREDWILPTERLIDHSALEVRVAAMGALLKHGLSKPIEQRLDADDAAVRTHAVVLLAENAGGAAAEHPAVLAVLRDTGPEAEQRRVALLQATRGHTGWTHVIVQCLEDPAPEVSDLAIRCAGEVVDSELIEPLLKHLESRRQRELVREALVAQGKPALEAAADLLDSAATPARIRRHLPRTISRFTNQRAADILLYHLTKEPEGLVRYKALRGLGRLVTQTEVVLDRAALEALLLANLEECLRMQVIHFLIDTAPNDDTGSSVESTELLLDLLENKANQALERAFRILQMLNKKEDVRRIANALRSNDRMAHAQALEYLVTLALDLDVKTRELLRLATDNLDVGARVAQVRLEMTSLPENQHDAIRELVEGNDGALREIAEYHLKKSGSRGLLEPADSPTTSARTSPGVYGH